MYTLKFFSVYSSRQKISLPHSNSGYGKKKLGHQHNTTWGGQHDRCHLPKNIAGGYPTLISKRGLFSKQFKKIVMTHDTFIEWGSDFI